MPAETEKPSAQNPPAPKPARAHAELSAADLRGIPPLPPQVLEQAAQTGQDGELLGQQIALDAIRLAIGIDAPGYNVFVTGVRGGLERESILRLLREAAARMPAPGDWVYVN